MFPSIFEGLGNVLIEALSLGVPIISSDCPYGPREILAPGTELVELKAEEYAEYGVLVPYGGKQIDKKISEDECCLSHAIVRMLSDNELLCRYRKKSYERAKFFEPINIAKQWNKVI